MFGNRLVTTAFGVGILLAAPGVRAQEATQAVRANVVAHTTALSSGGGAALGFEMSNGKMFELALEGGAILFNGNQIGAYRRGQSLESAWRDFVRQAGALNTQEALASFAEFAPAALNGAEQAGLSAIRLTVENLQAGRDSDVGVFSAPLVPVEATPRVAEAMIAAEHISAQVNEQVALALEGAEGRGTVIRIEDAPRASAIGIGSVVGGLTNLAAVFLAMMFIGFGMTFFAPRRLETVSDMVFRSFGRSFLAGLFAQPLIVPAFGMMIVGLALTVVGILVVPFATVAYVAAVVLALAMGYIAVARSIGEIYVRRKTGQVPEPGSWLPLKFVAYGLAALLAIWLPAIFLSWVPVAGNALAIVAAILTWVIATAGFGATIVSRGGVRGTIIRRIDAALTDEHYWDDVASLSIPGPSSRHSS